MSVVCRPRGYCVSMSVLTRPEDRRTVPYVVARGLQGVLRLINATIGSKGAAVSHRLVATFFAEFISTKLRHGLD